MIEVLHLSCAALYRWTKVHELLIQQRIRKDLLAQAVKESSAMLRSTLCHIQNIKKEHSVKLLFHCHAQRKLKNQSCSAMKTLQ